MDHATQQQFENLWSMDREAQNTAFFAMVEQTNQPVDWPYEVWGTLREQLQHPDNHNRAIAAQILCNLAKSDPECRIIHDLPALLAVTKDPRFVTARHCMQALWKVGTVGKRQQEALLQGLERRFHECSPEKNCTLIRSDILQSLRNVYDVTKDESIRARAVALIEIEEDPKYRKKYATLWRVKRNA
jgi:hypothetical protein